MTVPELVAYIRHQSQAGVSAAQVREDLMATGWSELDVENALHDVAAGLSPVTAGASIHEDLAQVRGLVAHLSSRVGRLEARLSGAAMLTEPEELPSATMQPARALPVPRRGTWGVITGAVVMLAACFGAGTALASVSTAFAGRALITAGAVCLVLAIAAWYYVRRNHAWSARYAAAMAVALGAWSVWLAWNSYALIEWTTASALGVLLLVYLVVAARWIRRLQ